MWGCVLWVQSENLLAVLHEVGNGGKSAFEPWPVKFDRLPIGTKKERPNSTLALSTSSSFFLFVDSVVSLYETEIESCACLCVCVSVFVYVSFSISLSLSLSLSLSRFVSVRALPLVFLLSHSLTHPLFVLNMDVACASNPTHPQEHQPCLAKPVS